MFVWTAEKIQTVRDLWGKQSAEQIACVIGHHSRSAVCGKAHRLGLSRIHKQKARATPFRKPPPQHDWHVIARMEYREIFDAAPLIEGCTLMELTSKTCRFPLWTDAQPERLYCGAVPAKGSVYCGCHTAIAWRSRSAA